jgi:hypothetical protein
LLASGSTCSIDTARRARPASIGRLSAPHDTKSLIETAIRRFLEEVPALAPLKLVIALELRGRGDIQLYRVALPGPDVSKRVADDARVRVSIPRSNFNELAREGHVKQWREAVELGHVRADGPDQILRLVANVVAKQEERSRTRRARG